MRLLPIKAAIAFSLWASALASPAQTIKMLVQSSPLAGFQYYVGKVRWSEMQVGDTLSLIREPENPHDAKAIRVEWKGEKLGYLPRAENRAVAAEMDRGGKVEARIAALREAENPWKRVLIEVFVVL
ncbi:MAG TPA: HIRAN domain-containing protein [Rhodocyclaceae bacterium]|nr:HIRAN domain-containing protein [Rhodocyclaceae bacterium]